MNAWVAGHPRYAYTATVTELDPGGAPVVAVLHITYNATTNVETAHVVSGRMAGADITYTGGTTADVRAPGLAHMFSIRLALRDPRLLSPHGNDARVSIFSNVTRCFEADATHLNVEDSGSVLAVTDNSPSCTVAAGYGTLPITSDRLLMDDDGQPLERDRYDGTTLVEKWTISDLQAS
jgi:hypothetical protein